MKSNDSKRLDAVIFVPTPGLEAYAISAETRMEYGFLASRFVSAALRAEAKLGYSVGLDYEKVDHGEVRLPVTGESNQNLKQYSAARKRRSLTSVALASELERSDLIWRIYDLGLAPLKEYRKILRDLSETSPKIVGISTTYFVTSHWLDCLIQLIRRHLPNAKIVVGGHMYGTNVDAFFGLDADYYIVGEAEDRLSQILTKIITQDDSVGGMPGLMTRYEVEDGADLSFPQTPKLKDIGRPNWRLSNRIFPSIDPAQDATYMALETQRGCLFKCKFCTFRTLQVSNLLPVDASVEAIMDFGEFNPNGILMLTDATATFPRPRWQQIIQRVAQRGGSKVPIFCYARATDLDETVVKNMMRANVVRLFIGQESGDDEILKSMAKGVTAASLKDTVRVLEESQIEVIASFIHGYPGETYESIEKTRAYIVSLNDNVERVVVENVSLSPFLSQDLAAVSQKWDSQKESAINPYDEVVRTFLSCASNLRSPNFFPLASTIAVPTHSSQVRAFEFDKMIQRQIANHMKTCEDESKIDAKVLDIERAELLRELQLRGQRKKSFAWRFTRVLIAYLADLLGSGCRNPTHFSGKAVAVLVWIWAKLNGVRDLSRLGSSGSLYREQMQANFVNRGKDERLRLVEQSDFIK